VNADDVGVRLLRALTSAGLAVENVVIHDVTNKATWCVVPASLQAQAQTIIDAFDPTAPSVIDDELECEAKRHLDEERLASSLVWVILDTYSPPATKAKYLAARNKIVTAFKSQPWK